MTLASQLGLNIMKLSVKIFLVGVTLLAVSVTHLRSEELVFSVEFLENEQPKMYNTVGYLVGENGLSVVGLPNDVVVKNLTVVDGVKKSQMKVLSYDPYARYAFVKVPEVISKGKSLTKIGKVSDSLNSVQVSNKDEHFIVAGRVERQDGQVLPFSFLRLHKNKFHLNGKNFPFVKSVDGSLVGMLHSSVPATSYGFYAIPGDLLVKGVADIKAFGSPTRAWIGVILDAAFDLPVVKSVRPASPAAKAGVKKGDIITQIGDDEVRNYGEAVKAFYLLQAEKNTQFKIIRAEERKVLTFAPGKFPLGSLESPKNP